MQATSHATRGEFVAREHGGWAVPAVAGERTRRTPGWRIAVAVFCLALLGACGDSDGGGDGDERVFGTGSAAELQLAQDLTRGYLDEHRGQYGLDDGNDTELLRVWVDELGMAHVHLRQVFGGVPVFGGELIVHWNSDGTLFGVSDTWRPGLAVTVVPDLTEEQAIGTAIAAFGCPDCLTAPPEVKLWVLRRLGVDRLAYRVQLRSEAGTDRPTLPVYFVDAHTAEVAWDYDNLQSATGSSLYSGIVSFDTSAASGTHFLEDLARGYGTFDFRNTTTAAVPFTDADDVWDAANQRAAVDVHYGLAVFLDYLRDVHGRDGFNGNGGPTLRTAHDGVTPLITAQVHFASNFNNGFWNGSSLIFGDGDGVSFGPLVSIDLIGHEAMHAVIEHTAGLVYSGESGAINESIADVFGAMVERHARGLNDNVWRFAEDIITPSIAGDALRHLDDPHRAPNAGFTPDDDPDHYAERYVGSFDNGGIHVNAGIANKVFYLLAQGGTHHLGGSMSGIGADAAARIWYKALTTFMTSSTNFAAARSATLNAALALYGSGSAQAGAVAQAWTLCGVGAPASPTPTPAVAGTATLTPTATPLICFSADRGELLQNGGFESGATPWV